MNVFSPGFLPEFPDIDPPAWSLPSEVMTIIVVVATTLFCTVLVPLILAICLI
jgi:hypothetical protein